MTEKETKNAFELVNVATQTETFVRDTEEDKILDDKEALAKILNELADIKKILGQ